MMDFRVTKVFHKLCDILINMSEDAGKGKDKEIMAMNTWSVRDQVFSDM